MNPDWRKKIRIFSKVSEAVSRIKIGAAGFWATCCDMTQQNAKYS